MPVSTYTIRQFGVVSVGKFFAVFCLVWGFFAGLVFALGLGGAGAMMGGPALGLAGGFVVLIFTMVFMGALGFIAGAIVAFIYNIVLGVAGGIEMDLDLKT
jgi:hypothetical protein